MYATLLIGGRFQRVRAMTRARQVSLCVSNFSSKGRPSASPRATAETVYCSVSCQLVFIFLMQVSERTIIKYRCPNFTFRKVKDLVGHAAIRAATCCARDNVAIRSLSGLKAASIRFKNFTMCDTVANTNITERLSRTCCQCANTHGTITHVLLHFHQTQREYSSLHNRKSPNEYND